MEKTFYNIFKIFFKTGTLLLGGGYVILPLLTSELVDNKKWLTLDELCEYYAISSSLPGVIAVNTAIFTGRKLQGRNGAIAALLGIITPAFLAIVLLASIVTEISSFQFVSNIFWGVGIGVLTLLFLAIREMWGKCVEDNMSSVIYAVCLILAFFKILPLFVIIMLAVVSGIIYAKYGKKDFSNVFECACFEEEDDYEDYEEFEDYEEDEDYEGDEISDNIEEVTECKSTEEEVKDCADSVESESVEISEGISEPEENEHCEDNVETEAIESSTESEENKKEEE